MKVSLFIGSFVGLIPVGAQAIIFSASLGSTVWRSAYYLYALGLPGMIFEALVMREPHGGGTPMETLFIILPFNVGLYSLLSYGVVATVSKLTDRYG